MLESAKTTTVKKTDKFNLYRVRNGKLSSFSMDIFTMFRQLYEYFKGLEPTPIYENNLTVTVTEIDVTATAGTIYELVPQEANTLFVTTGCYYVCTEVAGTPSGELNITNSFGLGPGGSVLSYVAANGTLKEVKTIIDESYAGNIAYDLNAGGMTVTLSQTSTATAHKIKVVLIGKKITYTV
jgi:hypothetical protein